jgi:hypothetical protein
VGRTLGIASHDFRQYDRSPSCELHGFYSALVALAKTAVRGPTVCWTAKPLKTQHPRRQKPLKTHLFPQP